MKIEQIMKIRMYDIVMTLFADHALFTVCIDMAPFTVARALAVGAGHSQPSPDDLHQRLSPQTPLTFII